MKRTINQMAEALGYDRTATYNLVKFMEVAEIAKKTGETVRPESGKGKGADVYEIAPNAVEVMSEIVKKLAG